MENVNRTMTAESPEMSDEERQSNIELFKDLIKRLEERRETSMTFAISVRRDDVKSDHTLCSMYGESGTLMEMVSQLSEPLIEPIIAKLKARAQNEARPMPRGLNPEDRAAADLLN